MVPPCGLKLFMVLKKLNAFSSIFLKSVSPGISSLKVTFKNGPLDLLKSLALAVTDRLVWACIFWMAPWKQNCPTAGPPLSAKCREIDWLHSWPGSDCCRLPVGDVRSRVPSLGMLRCQVKLYRGMGRQASSLGMVSRLGVHDAMF